ncbi:MAG: amidohydrolase [Bacteroidales bacterium]|nr:amidohydrolase [Bacteroidales bacterium]
MSLFIKDVLLNGKTTSIFIENDTIVGIGNDLSMPIDVNVIDGSRRAVFPTFANMHTHAAMTLFRGYGDDHPLQEWLNEWIWPAERNLDDEIIYWGTRLACLEMIKSGTTLFNDMYFYPAAAMRAVKDSGIRAMIGFTGFDFFNKETAEKMKKDIAEWWSAISKQCSADNCQIILVVAPHAPYTVSGETLVWLADFAAERGLHYHIHMSETESEVAESLKQYGQRPYTRLEKLGVLERCGKRFIGAHSLHLDDEEIRLIGQHHASVVHNPNSNLKLGSGYRFMYNELRDAGANVTLGTDGCSSSNNLDMLEATKTMALLQKGWRGDPTAMPAGEALKVASSNGFGAAGVNAGKIEVGAKADLLLVDIDNIGFIPDNDTLSNYIYAAHSEAIDTVLCAGNIVMQKREVKDEKLIKDEARRVVKNLIKK